MVPKSGLPPPMLFPSELREPSTRYLEASKPIVKQEEDSKDSTGTITPPPAYTEFLEVFSPIFTSSADSRASFARYMLDRPRRSPPTSAPSTATSASFFDAAGTQRPTPVILPPLSPASPWSAQSPDRLRRLRIPPPYLASPASTAGSPRSAHLLWSPYSPPEWVLRRVESPVSENGEVCVRHVITTTITFKRAPRLDPAPLGKRRRNVGPREA